MHQWEPEAHKAPHCGRDIAVPPKPAWILADVNTDALDGDVHWGIDNQFLYILLGGGIKAEARVARKHPYTNIVI